MPTPQRIQYRRGHRLPANAVFIGRPSKYGNPFRVSDPKSLAERRRAVEQHRQWIETQPGLIAQARAELASRDLACYCRLDGLPCHGDNWLIVANPPGTITAAATDPWACARHRIPAGERCALCEDQTELLPLAQITGVTPWNGARA